MLPPVRDEQVRRPRPSELHQAPGAEADPAVLALMGRTGPALTLLELLAGSSFSSSSSAGAEAWPLGATSPEDRLTLLS